MRCSLFVAGCVSVDVCCRLCVRCWWFGGCVLSLLLAVWCCVRLDWIVCLFLFRCVLLFVVRCVLCVACCVFVDRCSLCVVWCSLFAECCSLRVALCVLFVGCWPVVVCGLLVVY